MYILLILNKLFLVESEKVIQFDYKLKFQQLPRLFSNYLILILQKEFETLKVISYILQQLKNVMCLFLSLETKNNVLKRFRMHIIVQQLSDRSNEICVALNYTQKNSWRNIKAPPTYCEVFEKS